MTRSGRTVLFAIVVAVMAAGVLLWWRLQALPGHSARPGSPPEALATPASALVPAPAVAVPSPPVPEPIAASSPLAASDLEASLVSLLGRKTVLTMLQTGDLPRRLAATVDNLGRAHAPVSLWPLNPTGGHFEVITRDGRTLVSPDNALRYAPLVLLAEGVDVEKLADWYVRALPLLQSAYEELGFPGRRFHARMLEVIDSLLATPAVPNPLLVTLTEVRGPVPSQRPWVRYEFADPALQEATAGQKILLRVGAVNQRRLKAWLTDFRRALASRAMVR